MREIDGCFHNDPPIPESLQKSIAVLSSDDSAAAWDQLVSKAHRHFMLLPNACWPAKLAAKNPMYTWQDDWNNGRVEPLRVRLRALPVEPDATTFVLWMRENGVKTVWATFCSCWMNFLYEDEGCIVVMPESGLGLVFSNGRIWQGPGYDAG